MRHALLIFLAACVPLPGASPFDPDDDWDGDGFTEEAGDCDDEDPQIFPSAPEVPYDDIDQDCNGSDLCDADGDGIDGVGCPTGSGTDCDDTTAEVHPGATEAAYDGIDQDCDGFDLCDVDGDGFDARDCDGGDDCDDADITVFPGAIDPCGDGLDTDCDGDAEDLCALWGELSSDDADAVRTGPLQGSYNMLSPLPDLDGNGADEVVAGGPAAYFVEVIAYQDGALEVLGRIENPGKNGLTGAGTADVNGDGVPDVLVGMGSGSETAWLVDGATLLEGHGLVTVANNAVSSPIRNAFLEDFGASLAGPGDLDDDGTADLAIGAPQVDVGGYGGVYIVSGPVSGPVDVADHTMLWGVSVGTGMRLADGGDANGDGLADLLVTAPGELLPGRTYLLLGGSIPDGNLGIDDISAGTYVTTLGDAKLAVAMDADLDGDGLDDVMVGHAQENDGDGIAWVYFGGSAGLFEPADADLTVVSVAKSRAGLGKAVAGLTDTDGDGQGELVVTGPGIADPDVQGMACVLLAPSAGTITFPGGCDAVIEGTGSDAGLGEAALGSIRMDGDPFTDLLLLMDDDPPRLLFFHGGPGAR